MDTIAAIATPLSQNGAGISVIRISGEKALAVAAGVFAPFDGRDITQMEGYTACYGRVSDASGPIDDVVLLVFRAPKSYTGEDTVEISCHGGAYLTQRVLRAVLDAGARPADAGEFTKRAFLAGKLDLAQAEGVMELIAARGRALHRSGLAMRGGVLSQKIERAASELITISGELAAWLDYPDEDIAPVSADSLLSAITQARQGIASLLAAYDSGAVLRGGIDTVIVGRPNAGKSTLMNFLLGYERSIVTSTAGTTRDVVEEEITLDGITLRLADTAGIRDTAQEIERIGVALAHKRMASAQLILAVFDGSQALEPSDQQLVDSLVENSAVGVPVVAIINKSDLPQRINDEYIRDKFTHAVEISAQAGTGLAKLTQAILAALALERVEQGGELIVSERQRGCLLEADRFLQEAVQAVESGITLDAVGAALDCALAPLLELTGKRVTDAVVDNVFSRFCVGK